MRESVDTKVTKYTKAFSNLKRFYRRGTYVLIFNRQKLRGMGKGLTIDGGGWA